MHTNRFFQKAKYRNGVCLVRNGRDQDRWVHRAKVNRLMKGRKAGGDVGDWVCNGPVLNGRCAEGLIVEWYGVSNKDRG